MEESHPASPLLSFSGQDSPRRMVLHSDGYAWVKYGEKRLSPSGMLREYYKCHNWRPDHAGGTKCPAKKVVDTLCDNKPNGKKRRTCSSRNPRFASLPPHNHEAPGMPRSLSCLTGSQDADHNPKFSECPPWPTTPSLHSSSPSTYDSSPSPSSDTTSGMAHKRKLSPTATEHGIGLSSASLEQLLGALIKMEHIQAPRPVGPAHPATPEPTPRCPRSPHAPPKPELASECDAPSNPHPSYSMQRHPSPPSQPSWPSRPPPLSLVVPEPTEADDNRVPEHPEDDTTFEDLPEELFGELPSLGSCMPCTEDQGWTENCGETLLWADVLDVMWDGGLESCSGASSAGTASLSTDREQQKSANNQEAEGASVRQGEKRSPSGASSERDCGPSDSSALMLLLACILQMLQSRGSCSTAEPPPRIPAEKEHQECLSSPAPSSTQLPRTQNSNNSSPSDPRDLHPRLRLPQLLNCPSVPNSSGEVDVARVSNKSSSPQPPMPTRAPVHPCPQQPRTGDPSLLAALPLSSHPVPNPTGKQDNKQDHLAPSISRKSTPTDARQTFDPVLFAQLVAALIV